MNCAGRVQESPHEVYRTAAGKFRMNFAGQPQENPYELFRTPAGRTDRTAWKSTAQQPQKKKKTLVIQMSLCYINQVCGFADAHFARVNTLCGQVPQYGPRGAHAKE